jgi:hypothetical protein
MGVSMLHCHAPVNPSLMIERQPPDPVVIRPALLEAVIADTGALIVRAVVMALTSETLAIHDPKSN